MHFCLPLKQERCGGKEPMLQFESEIDGKLAQIGLLRKKLKNYGFSLGSNWDYNRGFFDATLSKQDGEIIYLRLPFVVISGMLDSENAHIQFQTPYVIKHVGKAKSDFDESTFLDTMGLQQVPLPIEPNEEFQDQRKWVRAGEQVVGKVLQYIN